jgi:hypothetical protein
MKKKYYITIFPLNEQIFDRHDKYKKEKEIGKPGDHIEMKVESNRNPRMIKIEKGTSRKRRKSMINLVKDYMDDLSIVHDECKDCDEDINQHIIPIKEYAKPFKEKLKKINCKLFPMAQRKLHQIRFRESLIRWLSWMKTRRKAFH